MADLENETFVAVCGMLARNELFSARLYPVNKNIFNDFVSPQPAGVGRVAAGEVTGVHTPSEVATVTRQKS
jgi:hypothetical protein